MRNTSRPGFGHKAVLAMSIIQTTCGMLSIIFGGVQIKKDQMYGNLGYGIWTGIFFITAGILGILSWRFKNSCNIVAHMVTSIVACLFGWCLLGFSATSLTNASYGYCDHYGRHGYNSSRCAVTMSISAILVIISALEIVVSIVSSAYCCRAVCCCARSNIPAVPHAVVQYNAPPGGAQYGQHVVMVPLLQPGQQAGQPIYLNQSAPVHQGQVVYQVPAAGMSVASQHVPQSVPVNQGNVAYQVQVVPATGLHVQNQPTLVGVPAAGVQDTSVIPLADSQPGVVGAQATASPIKPPEYSKTQDANFDYIHLDEDN